MKLLLLLFLFGTSSCFPQDQCNPTEEIGKCYEYSPDFQSYKYMETDQEVENACKAFTCILEYYKRCPWIDPNNYVEKAPLERYWRALCDPQSKKEFRKKYFDNVKCLIKYQGYYEGRCSTAERSCENLTQSFQCSKHLIAELCGQDAVDVYGTIDIRFDLYDCPRPQ